ncbi:MAG TPA: GAF domain-containing SpoIIE family protein phosphatase, partial [Rhodothermales bacterium]
AVTNRPAGLVRPRIAATVNVTEEAIHSWVDMPSLYDEVNETRELILLEQAPADRRVRVRPGDGVGSLLVVPLVARDELLGALFATKPVTFGFEKDDIDAIGVFAAQAALALDHARLFEEQVEKERLSRELDIARAVQRRLLPQHVPNMPGATIAASSVPALEVGGDYYDFARLDEHRLAFIVADVAGKGTSAAFYMAEMQGIFQSVSRISSSPTDFLVHANNALSPSLERQTFISVIYGILDTRTEEVTLARAGHCPAALINLHGDTRFLRSRGLGLGLDRTERFGAILAEERVALSPGDVLVLYTDGVVETRNPSGEEYGYDRLLEILRKNRHEDVDDLHRAIVRDLTDFAEDENYGDDMTIMILKWQGVMSTREIARSPVRRAAIER